MSTIIIGNNNCPINEITADGDSVGRCWFYVGKNEVCPRHGDVRKEIAAFRESGKLTREDQREKE